MLDTLKHELKIKKSTVIFLKLHSFSYVSVQTFQSTTKLWQSPKEQFITEFPVYKQHQIMQTSELRSRGKYT